MAEFDRKSEEGSHGSALDRAQSKMESLLSRETFQKSRLATEQRKAQKLAASQPEVHLIGEILAGSGFDGGVCCKWAVETGSEWLWLNGHQAGQTQVDVASSMDAVAMWSHPIDVHYVAGSLHGWPRLLVEVWGLDEFGKANIAGYGFAHVPPASGTFELDIPTWRPVGSKKEELLGELVGSHPQLVTSALISSKASERYRFTSMPAGKVHVVLDVVTKNFEKHAVEW